MNRVRLLYLQLVGIEFGVCFGLQLQLFQWLVVKLFRLQKVQVFYELVLKQLQMLLVLYEVLNLMLWLFRVQVVVVQQFYVLVLRMLFWELILVFRYSELFVGVVLLLLKKMWMFGVLVDMLWIVEYLWYDVFNLVEKFGVQLLNSWVMQFLLVLLCWYQYEFNEVELVVMLLMCSLFWLILL